MQTYLVGGAVRDRLLGVPVFDRDWVVVGASVEQMLQQGYQPVGKEFPVFLHPKTKEECALARTERKAGRGYQGFEFFADPGVTLEQDLQRRDLTINAMAESPSGQLIDPYGGQRDLAAKTLRHVSPAFAEDPLRVLRVARFAARFAHLGFCIAADTLALMTQLSTSGELLELSSERVWKEIERALGEPTPSVFFDTLHRVEALAALIPEMLPLFDSDRRQEALAALDRCAALNAPSPARLAVLGCFLDLPADRIGALCDRLRAPREYREFCALLVGQHHDFLRFSQLDPQQRLALYEGMDLQRRPERLAPFILACQALSGGDERALLAAQQFQHLCRLIEAIQPKALVAEGFKGKALGEELRRRRLAAITRMMEKDNDH